MLHFQLWRKFGDAKNDGPGPNPSTTTVTDDVFLILTTNKEVNTLYFKFSLLSCFCNMFTIQSTECTLEFACFLLK